MKPRGTLSKIMPMLFSAFPFACNAMQFTADCTDALQNMGVPPELIFNWHAVEGDSTIRIIDMQCEVNEISADAVTLSCPYLNFTDENPRGMGPIILRSQGNILNARADLIISGNVMGVCQSLVIDE